MEDNDLRNKVIITTNRKLELVKKLSDFMNVKGLMILGRMNPHLIQNQQHQSKIVRFLTSNSEIRSMAFWNRLSEAKQHNVAKIISFQEINEDNKRIRLGGSKENAEIYICLSGSAAVKYGDSEEKVYGPGQVFGNMEAFEQEYNESENHQVTDSEEENEEYDEFDPNAVGLRTPSGQASKRPGKKKFKKPKPKKPVMLANFSKGSFMRLSLADYQKYVVAEEEIEDIEAMKKEDEAIAGIAYDLLTQNDFFYITVYKRCKEMLKYDLFEFMNSYHMIPRNAKMLAHKYYNEADTGTVNYIEPEDGLFVFVVINGCMRLEILPVGHEMLNRDHSIACNRKGNTTLSVATKSMPLMLLQSGSMMWLQDQCFTVGQTELKEIIKKNGPEDNSFDNPSLHAHEKHTSDKQQHRSQSASGGGGGGGNNDKRRNSDASASSLMSAVSLCSVDGKFPRSRRFYTPRPRPTKESSISGNKKGSHHRGWHGSSQYHTSSSQFQTPLQRMKKQLEEADETFLYHIRMTFDSPTTYLAVPIENFDKILDNEELILPEMASEIKAQLQYANSSIYTRIKGLLPWILGNQDFIQPEIKPNTAENRPIDFKLEDFVPANPEDMMTVPQGSFLRHQQSQFDISLTSMAMMTSKSMSVLPPMPLKPVTPKEKNYPPRKVRKLPLGPQSKKTPKHLKAIEQSSNRSLSSHHSHDKNKKAGADGGDEISVVTVSDGDSLGSLMKITSGKSKSMENIVFVNKMKQQPQKIAAKIIKSDSFDKNNPLIKVFQDEGQA